MGTIENILSEQSSNGEIKGWLSGLRYCFTGRAPTVIHAIMIKIFWSSGGSLVAQLPQIGASPSYDQLPRLNK